MSLLLLHPTDVPPETTATDGPTSCLGAGIWALCESGLPLTCAPSRPLAQPVLDGLADVDPVAVAELAAEAAELAADGEGEA